MNWKKIFGLTIGIIILIFLINVLYNNWHDLKDYEWQLNIFWLIISFLFLALSPIILTFSWLIILKGLKEKANFLKTFNILNISNMVRYIPGNIWYIAGRVSLFKRQGISMLSSSAGIFIDLSMALIIGAFLYLVTIILGYNSIPFPTPWIIIPLLIILASLMHPFFFNTIFQKIFLKLKKKKIKLKWQYDTTLSLFALYTILWIVQGLSFFFLIKAIYNIPFSLIILVIGIHAIAWVLSFLTFISPAGLGVKEGILVLLLQPSLPLEITIVASILFRIMTIIQESIFAGISILINKKTH